MSSIRPRLLVGLAAGALLLSACATDDNLAATPDPSASADLVCPLPPPTEVEAPAAGPAPATLQYADLVEGDGAEAVTGSQVEVKYVGAFYDTGEEFDSSWSRGPEETLPFGICRQGVIPGFAVGPTGMKVGGRRLILIPSRLGYGPEGSPPTIPANADLVFVVDLVSVD
jgi:peptidylprolyl isomerase